MTRLAVAAALSATLAISCGGDAESEVSVDAIADLYDGASAISCRYVEDDEDHEVFRCTGEGFPPGCYYVGNYDNLVSLDCPGVRKSE